MNQIIPYKMVHVNLMSNGRAVGHRKVIVYGTDLHSKEKREFLHFYKQLCDKIQHKSNQQ